MLTFDQIAGVSAHLAGLDLVGRAANPCVGRERADLVLSGCAILDAICGTWSVGREQSGANPSPNSQTLFGGKNTGNFSISGLNVRSAPRSREYAAAPAFA